VFDAVLANELADFGHRVAVMHGDEIGGHDFGDGFVAFHVRHHRLESRALLLIGWRMLCGDCVEARTPLCSPA
jgi:hypothetical protein